LLHTTEAQQDLVNVYQLTKPSKPQIEYLGRIPLLDGFREDMPFPSSVRELPSKAHEPIEIYAHITDKYGKIKQAVIRYTNTTGSINDESCQWKETNHNETRWKHTTMKLINGIPSNGTYLATIPLQEDKTVVHYCAHFVDELNYTADEAGKPFYVNDEFLNITRTEVNGSHGIVGAEIFGSEKITNVILHYTFPDEVYSILGKKQYEMCENAMEWQDQNTSHYQCIIPPKAIHTINMTQKYAHYEPFSVPVPVPYSGNLYEAEISNAKHYEGKAMLPPYLDADEIWYMVHASDAKGKEADLSGGYSPFFPSELLKNHFNGALVTIKVSNLNMNNRTGNIEIGFNGSYINETSFLRGAPDFYWRQRGSSFFPTYVGNVVGISMGDNKVMSLNTPVAKVQDSLSTSSFSDRRSVLSDVAVVNPISIAGNSSEFPFDHYVVNILLKIPLNYTSIINARTDFKSTGQFDKSVNSSWVPSVKAITALNDNELIRQYHSLARDQDLPPEFLDSFDIECITGKQTQEGKSACISHTFLNILIDFKRNYSIAAIIIPIVTIFYLLGANFVMRTNELPNRLVITLGVFAFLFAFIPIVTLMKPMTTTTVPSIADLLITLILTATITYTVSSVIASTPAIRNKFSKDSILIDGLAFLLVSAIVIGYIVFSRYPFDIVIWLTPSVIFGLGYGLLLRLLLRYKAIEASKSATMNSS
jgi:hypothetical protein